MHQNVTTLNISRQKIVELQNAGYNYCRDIPEEQFRSLNTQELPRTFTALDIYEEELLHGSILTYNEHLDNILKDEITPQSIVELTGSPGSGKTQICLQLCISVQLPKCVGGLNSEAIYICTNKNFSSERLKELATNFVEKSDILRELSKLNPTNFNVQNILKNIYCMNIKDIVELMACVKYLDTFLAKKNIRIIVIDSISYPLRSLDADSRHNTVFQIFRDLQSLSTKYNFSIVITNDLTTRINDTETYNTPSFGDSFYHCINTRIWLSKKSSKIFHAKLIKGMQHGPKESDFCL